MKNHRKKIQQLKLELSLAIADDAVRFKRSIIRQLDFEHRRLKSSGVEVSLEELFERTMRRLRVPLTAKTEIQSDLNKTKDAIATQWDEAFKNTPAAEQVTNEDYEKIVASTAIDFNEIEDTLKESIENEFRKMIKSDVSYNVLRSALLKKDIGDSTASTLANTKIAQFDTAYMVENASQAGVEKYKYDGTIKETTRDFCRDRLGKIFTLKELEEMDNGQGLPVIPSLGGYNCTHYLTPVIE